MFRYKKQPWNRVLDETLFGKVSFLYQWKAKNTSILQLERKKSMHHQNLNFFMYIKLENINNNQEMQNIQKEFSQEQIKYLHIFPNKNIMNQSYEIYKSPKVIEDTVRRC